MPGDYKFCPNCQVFTSRCSKDNRRCEGNIRRAKFELAERETRRREVVVRKWYESVESVVPAAGSGVAVESSVKGDVDEEQFHGVGKDEGGADEVEREETEDMKLWKRFCKLAAKFCGHNS
jgi:hypothetical protein